MRASRILFLSHSHAFGPFRVGSHHYARALAERGAEVVHLSTPISFVHRAAGRVSTADLQAVPEGAFQDDAGVTHVVPRTILPAPYGRFRVATELACHGIEPRFDAVLLDQPLLWHDSVRELAPRLIYRPTDLYPDGVKRTLQRKILAAADGVIATSSEVLAALEVKTLPHLVVENGVDAARFAQVSSPVPRPAVAIYVGAIDGRFDWAQVVLWARARPFVTFVIAGPHGVLPPALPNNITAPGAVAYEELPALLSTARVGLLPLSDDPLNAGRSPMKLYEYLAAGLSVVTRETPVLTAEPAAGLFTYTDGASALAALDAALAHPSPNMTGCGRATEEAWPRKAAELHDFIDALA